MEKYLKLEILTYNMYEHEDGQGWPCHGWLDTSGEVRSMHEPRLSRDIVSYVESCFYLDVPVELVCKMYVTKHIDMDAAARYKDFFLHRKDVLNIYSRLRK